MNCCGIEGPKDWLETDIGLPLSCCYHLPPNEEKCIEQYATEGCHDILFAEFQKAFLVFITIDIIVIVIHVSDSKCMIIQILFIIISKTTTKIFTGHWNWSYCPLATYQLILYVEWIAKLFFFSIAKIV